MENWEHMLAYHRYHETEDTMETDSKTLAMSPKRLDNAILFAAIASASAGRNRGLIVTHTDFVDPDSITWPENL